jgi:hypothetical protein
MVCSRADEVDFGEGEGSWDESVGPGSFDDTAAHLELLTVAPGVDSACGGEGEDVVCSTGDLADCVGREGCDGGRSW